MKDAFAALLQGSRSAGGSSQKSSSQKTTNSGAKRPRTASQSSQAPSGKYATCPVCASSVPKSFLELHVPTCLEKAKQQVQQPKSFHQEQRQQLGEAVQTPRPLTPATPAVLSADAAGPSKCSRQHDPPDAEQAQHAHGIYEEQGHAVPGLLSGQQFQASDQQQQGQQETPTASTPLAFRQATSQPGPARVEHPFAAPAARTQPPAPISAAPAAEASGPESLDHEQHSDDCEDDHASRLHSSSRASPRPMPPSTAQPSSKGGGGSSAPSAFDVLKQGQRLQQQVHMFFLERSPTGAWKWHWWQKGVQRVAPTDATAAWSCSTSLTVPKSTSGTSTGTSPKRIKATLQLLTNVPSGDGAAVNWDDASLNSNAPGAGRWKGGASVLKSALQKNVRVCRPDSAVRVALSLLKDDPGELLRRLSIICLEDALLHPALPLLMWLTAAQAKGYVLGGTMCNACLRIVYQLAAVDVRDMAPVSSANARTRTYAEVDAQLPHAEAALVKAMMVRAAYGGMQGDVHMVKGYAALWAARFAGEAGWPPLVGAEEAGAADAAGVPVHEQDGAAAAGTAAAAGGAGGGAPGAAGKTAAAGGNATATAGSSAGQRSTAPPGGAAGTQAAGAAGSHGSGAGASGAAGQAHDGALSAGASGADEQESQLMPSGMTAWLEYMRGVYMRLSMGAAVTQVTIVGPLHRDDIPLSAIDFHVSEVVPHLLQDAAVQAALQQLSISRLGFGEPSTEGQVRNAMWLHSSSTSNKAWVLQRPQSKRRRLQPSQSHLSPGPGTSLERHALAEQLDRDSAVRERLQPLWAAAAPVAQLYALAYIKQRLR